MTAALARPPRRVGFPRLLVVETRKLVDTRSSLWLLAAAVLLSLVVIAGLGAWSAVPGGSQLSWQGALGGGVSVLTIFLPIIAILGATAEWGQRTAIVTFALEPRRHRVLAAKLIAGLLLAVGAVVTLWVLSTLTLLAAGALTHGAIDWSLNPGVLAAQAGAALVASAQGLALGLLLMNAPAAIVAYFLIPIALTLLRSAADPWGSVGQWLDINGAFVPLLAGEVAALDVGHLAVSTTVWVVLPLALGALRLLRRDVR